MFLLRIFLKIVLAPVSLTLIAAKGVIHLARNLTSAVVGLFLRYVGVLMVYCLATQRWSSLLIFFIVGIAVVGILFMAVVLEETIEGLRLKIREI